MITDFGLAKTISDAHSLTGTGAIIGTPSYMSPEQSRGKHEELAEATDVYSLGAILYELLTLAPPFRGESVIDTLRKVQDQDPEPVSRRNPSVDRDLEAICLRCLEKRPADRYQTAAALHADLTRYLQGEPVLARPIGPARRVQKWCQRNPALAVFSAVFLISGIVSLIALTALWLRSEHHRGVAEARGTRLKDEVVAKEVALDLAETKSAQLAHSIQALFDILATSPEIREPAAEPLRRRVIEQAEQVYASITEDTPDDARMRFDQASSIFEVAKILDAMGAVREALNKIDGVLAIAGTLDQGSIGVPKSEYETRMGNWNIYKGHLQTKLGDFSGANQSFADGLAHFRQTGEAFLNETGSDSLKPYMVSGRAHALAQQAMSAIQAKDVKAAVEASRQCEEAWRSLFQDESISSQTDNIRFAIAHSFLILGQVYDVAEDLSKSEQLLAEAISIAETIDSVSVTSQVGARGILAACYHRYGIALARQDRFDEARAAYHTSIARFEDLVHDFPDVARYREFQSSARYSLAFTESLSKNFQLASDLLRQNIQDHRWLVEHFPDTAFLYWDRIGDNYHVISNMLEDDPAAKVADRMQVLEEAISSYEASLAERPDWKEPIVGLARAHFRLGGIFRDETDDLDLAESHLVTAIDRLEAIVNPDSAWHEARCTLAIAHHEYAQLLQANSETELAIEHCQRGLEVLRHPETKDIALDLVRWLAAARRLDEAEDELRRYVHELAQQPSDVSRGCQLALEIADSLEKIADQQRFRDLASQLTADSSNDADSSETLSQEETLPVTENSNE